MLGMAVDSGASATVIGENMVRAVEAKNPRPDIKSEVADGTHRAISIGAVRNGLRVAHQPSPTQNFRPHLPPPAF